MLVSSALCAPGIMCLRIENISLSCNNFDHPFAIAVHKGLPRDLNCPHYGCQSVIGHMPCYLAAIVDGNITLLKGLLESGKDALHNLSENTAII